MSWSWKVVRRVVWRVLKKKKKSTEKCVLVKRLFSLGRFLKPSYLWCWQRQRWELLEGSRHGWSLAYSVQTGDPSSHWPLGESGQLESTGQSGNKLQPIRLEHTGRSHKLLAQTNAQPASVKKVSGGSDPHHAKLAVPGESEIPGGNKAELKGSSMQLKTAHQRLNHDTQCHKCPESHILQTFHCVP